MKKEVNWQSLRGDKFYRGVEVTANGLREAFAELAAALKPEAGLPPLLTIEQAARLIQVSPSTLRAQLPAYVERGLRIVVLPSTAGGSPERRNLRVLRDSIPVMCRGLESAKAEGRTG